MRLIVVGTEGAYSIVEEAVLRALDAWGLMVSDVELVETCPDTAARAACQWAADEGLDHRRHLHPVGVPCRSDGYRAVFRRVLGARWIPGQTTRVVIVHHGDALMEWAGQIAALALGREHVWVVEVMEPRRVA